MAKKTKIQFLSLEFKNETGETHKANITKKSNGNVDHQLTSPCNCGESVCVNGVLYRCMHDPSGKCVWWETTESCI